VAGPEADVRRLGGVLGGKLVEDADGLPMMLFESEWLMRRIETDEKNLLFQDVQPRR
jgi:hypothetical protein